VRDGRDHPQRPPLTPGTERHIERKQQMRSYRTFPLVGPTRVKRTYSSLTYSWLEWM
jgi:hypothetical protein